MGRNARKKLSNGKKKVESMWEVDWTLLPDDTMIRLFSCLNNRDRASLSLSCKPWWILSKSPYLWQVLDLRLYKCDAQTAKIAIGLEGGVTALIGLAKLDIEEVQKNAAGALWNLALHLGNAMRIIQEDGVPTLIHLCSSSVSKMARLLSALTLACMFDMRLEDDLAMDGTSSESTVKSARLESARRVASEAIEAYLTSYYDAVSSLLLASETLNRVTELVRIQEAGSLQCSGSHIDRFLTMLCHPSPILKSFGAFALLQLTIPEHEHALRHTKLLKKAGAPRVLRATVASASTPPEAKALAHIVLKNLAHHKKVNRSN